MKKQMINWEGELSYEGKSYYAHADYKWGYDDFGKKTVVVESFTAYDEDDAESVLDNDFQDLIAETIQDELEDAA